MLPSLNDYLHVKNTSQDHLIPSQTCHLVFIKNTDKLGEVFKAKAEGVFNAAGPLGGPSGSRAGPWWGLGGEAPGKVCDLALLETP